MTSSSKPSLELRPLRLTGSVLQPVGRRDAGPTFPPAAQADTRRLEAITGNGPPQAVPTADPSGDTQIRPLARIPSLRCRSSSERRSFRSDAPERRSAGGGCGGICGESSSFASARFARSFRRAMACNTAASRHTGERPHAVRPYGEIWRSARNRGTAARGAALRHAIHIARDGERRRQKIRGGALRRRPRSRNRMGP